MNARYDKVVGIGGIGKGMLFYTDIDATLGRSESRLAELSGVKDYCKLHIVFHYVSAFLSPAVKVYPIGFVGNDADGATLLGEIKKVGMEISYIAIDDKLPTMIGICLQYPDKETCNFSSSNSACNNVSPEYVEKCMEKIGVGPSSIVVALPEVRIESRVHMIRSGKARDAFCALSVTESEAREFRDSGVFGDCDLFAVNIGEAAAIVPDEVNDTENGESVTARLYEYLAKFNKNIMLLVTCGKYGAYSAYGGRIEHIPGYPAETVNTTGAGDACLGGIISGLVLGMPFQKGMNDKKYGDSPLSSAAEFGTICAGMAVEAADTIAFHVNPESVREKIKHFGWKKENWFI